MLPTIARYIGKDMLAIKNLNFSYEITDSLANTKGEITFNIQHVEEKIRPTMLGLVNLQRVKIDLTTKSEATSGTEQYQSVSSTFITQSIDNTYIKTNSTCILYSGLSHSKTIMKTTSPHFNNETKSEARTLQKLIYVV